MAKDVHRAMVRRTCLVTAFKGISVNLGSILGNGDKRRWMPCRENQYNSCMPGPIGPGARIQESWLMRTGEELGRRRKEA